MNDLINDIIRDACECERPEKHDTDTVELRVSDLRLILERHLAALASAPADEPTQATRQYYWKDDRCEAFNAHKASCICWHDEGTGPYPDGKHPQGKLTWRKKPAAASPPPQATAPAQLDGVNAERLCAALTRMGVAGPAGMEDCAARLAEMVNRLTLAVTRAQATAQAGASEACMADRHTPGPWTIRRAFGIAGAIVGGVSRQYVNGQSQDQLFMVSAVDPDNGGETARDANAHLAAAAPDLLAALRRCRFDSLNMSLEDMRFIRGAIIKATGTPPSEQEAAPAPAGAMEDAARWAFVLAHACSGKAPKAKDFEVNYVPVGHNGSDWGRIEIEWKGPRWEKIAPATVNAIVDAARQAGKGGA